jgi:transposase
MHRSYTDEFKKEAVALAKEIGISKAARQLGISDSNIHGWRAKQEGRPRSNNKPATQLATDEQQELKALRKEVAELKKVNFILKQAAAFFSQDQIK